MIEFSTTLFGEKGSPLLAGASIKTQVDESPQPENPTAKKADSHMSQLFRQPH
jgi:hypothetical protein